VNAVTDFPAAGVPVPPNAIAIVGMACRFPGANSVSEFWDNLRHGEESIVTLSGEELAAAGVGQNSIANRAYVPRAPIIDGIDEFDSEFFGFTPQAARSLDPQHRLFLQCAWHALEDAGADPTRFEGSIGVYGATHGSAYLMHNVLSQFDPNEFIGQGLSFDMLNLLLSNDKDYLATRVSHQFNLRGPSIAVQSACSSALVAVHLACQSLLNGECDMALAGSVSIRIPHRVGYWQQPGMMSADGHCRPFDAMADGTVFGSGLGVVVLKPMRAAIDNGNRIRAVIRGSAVNNDGSMKLNYAAPSASAQADVIAEAHAVSGVDASTISFVEMHGTATPLGDPIEIEALRRAFGVSKQPRRAPCVIGSVKSNIGHLEVASGIAGLIKTILCLENQAIPATLHFTRPHPETGLADSPFVVQTEYGHWECDGVRRAGVHAFGVGGTNAHIVVEEAPAASARDGQSGPQVLLLSARTAELLGESRAALASALSGDDQLDMADVAYTLAGRRTENVRMAAVVADRQTAIAILGAPEHDNVFVDESVQPPEPDSDRVVFLFPGEGAQHTGMAHGLYKSEPVFAEHFDRCATAFLDELGIDLRTEVFGGAGSDLARTDNAQAGLFAVEYALAKLIGSYGVRAGALAGYGIGQYVAATLAGVFDLATAIKAVSIRGRLMQASGPGAMVAVPLGRESVAGFLSPDVDLAAVNDPGMCLVSGPDQHIRDFEDRLRTQGVPTRRVRTSHGFQSSLMDPLLAEFETSFSGLVLREPRVPLLSNVSGTWMSADQATQPAAWARHMRAPVLFSDELDVMLQDSCRVLVEAGPGGSLTASAARHPRWSSRHRAVRLMRHQAQNRIDSDVFLLALGQLWAAGVDVDWTSMWARRGPRLVSVPGYRFAHQRHWVDHNPAADWAAPTRATAPAGGPSSNGNNGLLNAAEKVPQIEATLLRIWTQCLGIESIDRNDNFFEIGGDSLLAIGVAMAGTREGLDLTPQDLYECQSIAALAATLAQRYKVGGLASTSSSEMINPPVPPNIACYLEHGLREAGRWRIPLMLRVSPEVGLEDIRSVLTAITSHHDALRVRLVERAGSWEQHFVEPDEFTELVTRSLPADTRPGTSQEREAVLGILAEHIRAQDLSSVPMTAAYVVGAPNGPRYLAITLHGIAADNSSYEILLNDILTAFAQRLAGQDIALEPVTTTWGEWSQRCVALASHPDVLEGRDYWVDNSTKANLRLAQDVAGAPHADDLDRVSSTLTISQTTEVDDARRRLRLAIDEILLAALGRTVAQVLGDGIVAVDLEGPGRSVLKPDVDLHRTVGSFTTIYPIALVCTAARGANAMQLLNDLHDTVRGVPHYGIGHGLLRYVYAPTSKLLCTQPPSDMLFSYVGTIPELPNTAVPVQLDSDMAMWMRESLPGLGHAVELRIYRYRNSLHLDWWYDTRRMTRSTVDALVQHFPLALTELIQEAIASTRADDESDYAIEALALVDLTGADSDDDEY
jgi:phthiocerol/phenolphthiocerol synthesis type-I polyketide synthase E